MPILLKNKNCMPMLFFSTMIIASFISLPVIKDLSTPPGNILKLPEASIQTPNINDTTFLLTGKISGQKKGIIKLIYTDKNGKYILDSSAVKNSRFQFRGLIAEPRASSLSALLMMTRQKINGKRQY